MPPVKHGAAPSAHNAANARLSQVKKSTQCNIALGQGYPTEARACTYTHGLATTTTTHSLRRTPTPQVHRHHPPLVYGRTMGGSPEQSEGVALCRVERGQGGAPAYGLITYQ